ncbi:hypothetical protein COU61_00575, partial [Candidatus Pacearchaeota archaeon CG10_big_fil_rev_8_21_14_0_10_35_13]
TKHGFLDRSLVDVLAYCELFLGGIPLELAMEMGNKDKRITYDHVFITEPLPYKNEGFRIEEDSKEQATIHEALMKAYQGMGYEPIMIPVMESPEVRKEYFIKVLRDEEMENNELRHPCPIISRIKTYGKIALDKPSFNELMNYCSEQELDYSPGIDFLDFTIALYHCGRIAFPGLAENHPRKDEPLTWRRSTEWIMKELGEYENIKHERIHGKLVTDYTLRELVDVKVGRNERR